MGGFDATRRLREELVGGLAPPAITLAGLCRRVESLLGARGVALRLTADGDTAVTEASGVAGSRVADAEATLGEGPTVDSLALRLPVLSSNLPDDRRWPQLAAAAEELGVHAVIAVPMLNDSDQLGVLTAYLDHAGDVEGPTITKVTHVARVLTGVILGLPSDPQSDPALATAISAAAVQQGRVHQAAGIISVDRECDVDEALVRLRGYAYSHDLLLSEAASAVIDEGLRLR